jgi:hypothetical protein
MPLIETLISNAITIDPVQVSHMSPHAPKNTHRRIIGKLNYETGYLNSIVSSPSRKTT